MDTKTINDLRQRIEKQKHYLDSMSDNQKPEEYDLMDSLHSMSDNQKSKKLKDHSTPDEIKHRQRRKKIKKLVMNSKRRNRR